MSQQDGKDETTQTAHSEQSLDPAVAALTYEQARDALVDVVRRLESGAETLEESLALWERGEALAARCEQWLAGARALIEAKRSSSDNTPAE